MEGKDTEADQVEVKEEKGREDKKRRVKRRGGVRGGGGGGGTIGMYCLTSYNTKLTQEFTC